MMPFAVATHLDTFRDPMRAFDEMISRLGWTQIACRLLEQGQPAVEVPAVDRQPQMFPHRLAMISMNS